jgi:hypothetical protein
MMITLPIFTFASLFPAHGQNRAQFWASRVADHPPPIFLYDDVFFINLLRLFLTEKRQRQRAAHANDGSTTIIATLLKLKIPETQIKRLVQLRYLTKRLKALTDRAVLSLTNQPFRSFHIPRFDGIHEKLHDLNGTLIAPTSAQQKDNNAAKRDRPHAFFIA